MQKHTRIHLIVGLLIASVLMLNGCDKSKEASAPDQPAMPEEKVVAPAATSVPAAQKLPDMVSFEKDALYPEGLEYDAVNNRFLVTSLREGIVGTVTPDGNYKVLFQDANMVSAIGIRIDNERDRVLVCNSYPGDSVHTSKETQGKLAGHAVFQLSTAKQIKNIELAGLSEDGGPI